MPGTATSPTFDTIEVKSDGSITVVTLNRPDAMNAADAVMHRELAEVWEAIGADPACRAVVLTGAGRAFSAGGDFPRMVETQVDQDVQDEVFAEARRTVHAMVELPQPIIAAVNGPAVGLGASLVALCDMAVAADTAFLADPHLGVGLVPADGAALLWPMTIGLMRAKEYIFTGARIPATTAKELGLVNSVVPAGEVLASATELAERVAALPIRAVRDTKRLLNVHTTRVLTGLLDQALACERASVNSVEHAELTRKLIERAEQRAATTTAQ
ncbi:enoyl-CoA hydratase/isomerase family protein [Gordonia sp. HNM0687]|uniref:Enoyl-CoA hydratase/isomerase family protein n=1 Tax=Gordonia mangrovi TaxID=2665643 RepID=A0A6L7GXX1_9ACTN|nr:enoyl-CoA hydratase/isomerase family protein [Gordonia mangrovi]MXP23488.1 enoyl-CoA hydratase/isomerase family protein [Gordonia mangrovi]UVF76618.1 enoyl-CoA hydratase/isomerase family protein [Gordonia mangrovi]